jgi:hypothetical protein
LVNFNVSSYTMKTRFDEENLPGRYAKDDDNPERTFSLAEEISISYSESLQPLNMATHPPHIGNCTGQRHRPVTKNSLKA